MDFRPIFEQFAENFVLKSYRERFVHEALKKPEKVLTRISHHIHEVFPKDYRLNEIAFHPETKGVLFNMSDHPSITNWSEAKKIIDMGSGGNLFVCLDGRGFYADSEGFPPPDYYTGSL